MSTNDVISLPNDVYRDAEILYQYHQMHMDISAGDQYKADAIFCLCSLDTRVAERAAQLLLDGHGEYLIFSGGSGKLTEGRFSKPEAEVFADIARGMGVPEAVLVIEPQSTNTGENVRYTHALLRDRGLLDAVRSLVLVQKPYMERRTYATFVRQWPGELVDIHVTSPQIAWCDYPDANNPIDLVINIAVGDLVRIRDYPAKGFQIPQDIPDNVWEAGQRLIRRGYNQHLP